MTAAALGGFGESANFTGALELGIESVGLNKEESLVESGVGRGGGGGAVVVGSGGRGAIIHEGGEGRGELERDVREI